MRGREVSLRFSLRTPGRKASTTPPWEGTNSLRVEDGGWDLTQSIALAKTLKMTGEVDVIDCWSGGLIRIRKLNFCLDSKWYFLEPFVGGRGFGLRLLG